MLKPGSGAFGQEYAWRPAWRTLQRIYVFLFGLVDLPGRLRARLIIKALQEIQFQKVLDIGSGTGCYSFYLTRQANLSVCGVEIDAKRISESIHIAERLRRDNLRFHLGSERACLKNFVSGNFDLALAVEVLQYLPDVRHTLKEIYRVLKPGGYLMGHLPVLGYLRPRETTLFDEEKIRNLLTEAGFQIVKVKPTFGGRVRKICSAYTMLSRSTVMMEILFPFFLLLSTNFRIECREGDYRFFIAQKPFEDQAAGWIRISSNGPIMQGM